MEVPFKYESLISSDFKYLANFIKTLMAADSPSLDLTDLKRKSVRNGVISLFSQAVTAFLQITSTIILARLLTPDDFGTITMVLALTTFAQIFRDLGLSAAAIQHKDLSHNQSSMLFWLNSLSGLILTVIIILVSPLIAWFYTDTDLIPLTIILSFTFFISSLGAQHVALLQREMRFGRKAISDISGAFINLAVAIFLAMRNMGPWSLALGTVAGISTSTGLSILLSSFRPQWRLHQLEWHTIRSIMKFGVHVTGFEFVNYFHRNLDNVLIGRFWGSEALGIYSRAYQLLMFPINNLRNPIQAVAFPAMSRLQHDPEAFRSYYRRISGILAFISMPITVFLGLNATMVIELALGSQWQETAHIFALLAISGFIQPVASLRGLVMLSTGNTNRYWQWGVINAVCVSIGFICGVPWGAEGVAASYAIINYVLLYPSMYFIFAHTPLKVHDFTKSIINPLIASLSSGLIMHVIATRFLHFLHLEQIIVNGALFSILYFLIFMIIPGGKVELQQSVQLFQQLRRKPS